MPSILPLQINALYLESPEQVIGQDIRFENVPWMNTQTDVFENPNVPLETNSIIPRPFSYDNAIYLDKGVHIHFVLPSYFKKFDNSGTLPKAPNRWYIKREKDGKEWIVESDYIWDINDPILNKSGTCTYVEEMGGNFHFKYIGRKYKLQEWINKDHSKENYLKDLSAFGWGSFSFDIHYPNCRSVFGFYDEEGTKNDAYTIIAWVEASANEYIVAGKFQLKPNIKNENHNSFDITIANTLPETLSALIINTNNPSISKQELQKQEEQIASMINFDELKGLNLDWISRLRSKQHEQQFNKTSGTTKFLLNIVSIDNDDAIQEYDFDINLLDFEFSKSISGQYENIRKKLTVLNESASSDEIVIPVWEEINLTELNNISFNNSLDDELESLNKVLNNSELDTFRLHTKIESLYLHWSTYLNALFINKNKNINKFKNDLALLISQINIVKTKLKNAEANVANLQRLFSEKISNYYSQYRDYAIIKFLFKAQHSGDDISRNDLNILLNLRYKTKIVLSKKSRTDYYNALPPTVIISSPKNNNIFNLFTNPATPEEVNLIDLFDCKQRDSYKKVSDKISGFNDINVNCWHTYKVEWESLFLPKKEGHYLSEDNIFNDSFLKDSYTLDELNADLIKQYALNDIAYMPNPNTYYGNSFVSNTIQEYVKEKVEKTLNHIDKAENPQLVEQIQGFLETLDGTTLFELTLSDFNNLMLQRSNGLSVLPLIPNGFEDHKELAKSIEALCKEYFSDLNLLTPNRLSIFNPFRNGAFKINRLRIVDSFGRNKIIEPQKIITTHVQKIDNKDNWVTLPPRYLQAAAISTRFISTITDKKKSPVLGWMVPVYLNQRIEFFDAFGKHLGAVDTEGQWEPSPFDLHIAQENTEYKSVVKNPHFKRIIHWIIEKICKTNKKDQFIKELQKAMEHTSPEDYDNPSLLETISSVPIAITLVNINLFTKGESLYDINYSENISINTYDNQRKYDKVKIPMSIGDLNQYNDGVLGYWHYNLKDDEKLGVKSLESKIYFNNDVIKKINNQSYSLKDFLKENPIDGKEKWNDIESRTMISAAINYKVQDKENFLALNDTLNSSQRYVLMHPKGNLHIKTGILPEKSIKLVYNKIKNSLKRIELTLLTTPVLTPKENLQLSLAKDNRYEWSWVELEKKNKKQPLSPTNLPVKKRLTQNLALDFDQNFETESDLQFLLSGLKNDGLLVNELNAFFPDQKIYFINKEEFDKKNYRYQSQLVFINDPVTHLIFKNEDIRFKKVAFDFNQFKTKKYLELKEFLIRNNYAIIPETNILIDNAYFINFNKIAGLQSKNESDINDFERELIYLLSLKSSNKIIYLKAIVKKIYVFNSENSSEIIKNNFKQNLLGRKIINKDPFYPDEQIYFVDIGELEKLKIKDYLDEDEKLLLKMVDNKSKAILKINDFNINSGTIPNLVLKEGWLSIKSTKF
ncbi:hypothetical protein OF897_21310 [Chryseobacterium formosus]|uniref:Uncharacterized protein n=1 Tax=Chryseobacterium formosus TaxID=1537363 RepID=A0ABT3XXR5_9FLAO|nr:hypothetical protein [Chryseobacterium formosus]MCX8526460.1 hypothetical protein [Chryseobacterium formosus]